jgi:hypothetical protein
MSRTCDAHERDEKCVEKIRNLQRGDRFGDLGVDGRIIFRLILKSRV